MTDKERQEWENAEVTITRGQLADIVAQRLAIERRIMHETLDSEVVAAIFEQIITNVCADICSAIFKDVEDTLEVDE